MFGSPDLLKSDTPINKAKVSLKLHELEYKLDVEKKVQIGIRKLASTFERDPSIVDRRRISEVQGQLSESNEKIKLLNKAVRKYKNLYIGEEDEMEVEGGLTECFVVFLPCVCFNSFCMQKSKLNQYSADNPVCDGL